MLNLEFGREKEIKMSAGCARKPLLEFGACDPNYIYMDLYMDLQNYISNTSKFGAKFFRQREKPVT